MDKISIDIYKENETWVAVAPDRLVGSKNVSLEKAACEVIKLACEADKKLEKIGVNRDQLMHDMSIAREQKVLKNHFFRLLLNVGLPIGAVTIAIIFVTGHIANTIWDRAENFRLLVKNDVKELILPAHTSSGSGVDLRSLASGLNDRILPAAEELNPAYRAFTETEARGTIEKN